MPTLVLMAETGLAAAGATASTTEGTVLARVSRGVLAQSECAVVLLPPRAPCLPSSGCSASISPHRRAGPTSRVGVSTPGDRVMTDSDTRPPTSSASPSQSGIPAAPHQCGAGGEPAANFSEHHAPVLVVVPTRNSERTLAACLHSLREQSLRPRIVVVDNFSTDSTQAIARKLADELIVAGPERAAQRNIGAAAMPEAAIIGFIDSDMVVDSAVVAEVAVLVASGAGAVVVPEQTVGHGIVAKIRAFERAQYVGSSQVEAARFFARSTWMDVGGFDEELTACEDWDLALRAVDAGSRIGHTQSMILHDEERVSYLAHCVKKGRYASGLRLFVGKHGPRARSVLLDRPYLRHPGRLLRNPLLGAGLVLLKLSELGAVCINVALSRRGTRHDLPGKIRARSGVRNDHCR